MFKRSPPAGAKKVSSAKKAPPAKKQRTSRKSATEGDRDLASSWEPAVATTVYKVWIDFALINRPIAITIRRGSRSRRRWQGPKPGAAGSGLQSAKPGFGQLPSFGTLAREGFWRISRDENQSVLMIFR